MLRRRNQPDRLQERQCNRFVCRHLHERPAHKGDDAVVTGGGVLTGAVCARNDDIGHRFRWTRRRVATEGIGTSDSCGVGRHTMAAVGQDDGSGEGDGDSHGTQSAQGGMTLRGNAFGESGFP